MLTASTQCIDSLHRRDVDVARGEFAFLKACSDVFRHGRRRRRSCRIVLSVPPNDVRECRPVGVSAEIVIVVRRVHGDVVLDRAVIDGKCVV